jgi:DNA-binding transcriptional LysR family regulator
MAGMQLQSLRSFAEVCRLGSITAAAAALGYTQSAVSRQIAGLEADTGAALLVRLPRGVAPTDAGVAVLRHARTIVRELDRMAEAVASPESAPVRLALGAVPSAAAGLVPRMAAEVRAAYPEARLTFYESTTPDLLQRVGDGDLDVAVVTDYPPGLPALTGVTVHHLLDDEVHVAMSTAHPLAGSTRRVRLERFAGEDWVEDYRGSARALVEACARAGFSPRIEHECGGWTGKLGLIAAGADVGIVPGLLAGLVRPDVVCRRLVDPPVRGVYAVVPDAVAEQPIVATSLDALARSAP